MALYIFLAAGLLLAIMAVIVLRGGSDAPEFNNTKNYGGASYHAVRTRQDNRHG